MGAGSGAEGIDSPQRVVPESRPLPHSFQPRPLPGPNDRRCAMTNLALAPLSAVA
jgi:hypothetical protein